MMAHNEITVKHVHLINIVDQSNESWEEVVHNMDPQGKNSTVVTQEEILWYKVMYNIFKLVSYLFVHHSGGS